MFPQSRLDQLVRREDARPSESGISQRARWRDGSPTLEASAWPDWSAPSPDGEPADREKDRRACGFACSNERVRSVRVPVEVDRDQAQVRVICLVARRAWRGALGTGRLDVADAAEDESTSDGQRQEQAAKSKRSRHRQNLTRPSFALFPGSRVFRLPLSVG